MPLNRSFNKGLNKAFNGLVLRQRLLIVFAVLSVVYVCWQFGIVTALHQQKMQLMKARYQLAYDVDSNAADVDIESLITTIIKLKHQLKDLDAELHDFSVVSYNDWPAMLRELLYLQKNIHLQQLNMLPKALLETTASIKFSRSNEADVSIYKHPLQLTLAGDLVDIIAYFKAVEALKWPFFLDEISYRIDRHSQVVIDVSIYTLSLGKRRS
ncbi:MAG: hypothetical protein KTR20_02550 [Cellvibrionaceae bacterium]|nr:hypothetical protein [Cellvibrionaceae bacterium]